MFHKLISTVILVLGQGVLSTACKLPLYLCFQPVRSHPSTGIPRSADSNLDSGLSPQTTGSHLTSVEGVARFAPSRLVCAAESQRDDGRHAFCTFVYTNPSGSRILKGAHLFQCPKAAGLERSSGPPRVGVQLKQASKNCRAQSTKNQTGGVPVKPQAFQLDGVSIGEFKVKTRRTLFRFFAGRLPSGDLLILFGSSMDSHITKWASLATRSSFPVAVGVDVDSVNRPNANAEQIGALNGALDVENHVPTSGDIAPDSEGDGRESRPIVWHRLM
ncbi:hypothetical protein DFH07DRAFT_778936 [Mycena maculata]|uniref:Uncharacterized protein n=1 Tax=Mycena maculata TaxID=230809 RepID=A0AAD7ICE7_9AGAR|nr:hypothetical protein DFH07DRAFT_778936 [Mycena maculata]